MVASRTCDKIFLMMSRVPFQRSGASRFRRSITGHPTFNIRLCGGMPGRSKDFRNSVGYCTESDMSTTVSIYFSSCSFPGNCIRSFFIDFAGHVISCCKDGTLAQPLVVLLVYSQVGKTFPLNASTPLTNSPHPDGMITSPLSSAVSSPFPIDSSIDENSPAVASPSRYTLMLVDRVRVWTCCHRKEDLRHAESSFAGVSLRMTGKVCRKSPASKTVTPPKAVCCVSLISLSVRSRVSSASLFAIMH